MAKPVTQQQFDALLERRVNIIARAVKDQIGTTENNPQHLDEATAEKVISYLEGVIGTLKANFEATLTRSAPATITTFSLGKKPAKPATRAPKAEKIDNDSPKRRHTVPAPAYEGSVFDGVEVPEEAVVEAPKKLMARDVVTEEDLVRPVQAVVKLEPKPAAKKPAPAPVVTEDTDEIDELDQLDALLADD